MADSMAAPSCPHFVTFRVGHAALSKTLVSERAGILPTGNWRLSRARRPHTGAKNLYVALKKQKHETRNTPKPNTTGRRQHWPDGQHRHPTTPTIPAVGQQHSKHPILAKFPFLSAALTLLARHIGSCSCISSGDPCVFWLSSARRSKRSHSRYFIPFRSSSHYQAT